MSSQGWVLLYRASFFLLFEVSTDVGQNHKTKDLVQNGTTPLNCESKSKSIQSSKPNTDRVDWFGIQEYDLVSVSKN